MGFSLIEPFGSSHSDDGARLVAAMLYNSNRGKDAPALQPSDFLKAWAPPVEFDHMAGLRRLDAMLQRRILNADD